MYLTNWSSWWCSNSVCRYISCHRDSLLFRLDYNSRELDAYVTTLGQLRACLYYLHKLVAFCGRSGGKPGGLFADENAALSAEDKLVAEQMMGEVEMLCQDTFYGRCLGFQVCCVYQLTISAISPSLTLSAVALRFLFVSLLLFILHPLKHSSHLKCLLLLLNSSVLT